MKKFSVVLMAALALLGASLAFAAPVELSNAQLDQVSAGQGVFDFVFGTGFTATGDPVVAAVDTNAADNGSVAGTDNVVVPIDVTGNTLDASDADAEDGSAAATGTGVANATNVNEDAEESVAATDSANVAYDSNNIDVEVEEGSALALDNGVATAVSDNEDAAIALGTGNIAAEDNDDSAVAQGTGNVALNDNDDSLIAAGTGNCVEENDIEAEIEEGGMGFAAKEATVTNSFNRQEIEIDVEVDIEDSFNVETNTLDISGQAGITAIVLANTLGDQAIGVNLNIANATSTQPTAETSPTAEPINAINGNALALTFLNQTVINNSIFIGIVTPLDGIVTDNQG